MACCTNEKMQEIAFAKLPIKTDITNKGLALTNLEIKYYAFAAIKTKKGSQIYGEVANFGEVATHNIFVDYSDELKDINSSYYIIANEKLYKIKEIINVNEENLQLNFICILQNTKII